MKFVFAFYETQENDDVNFNIFLIRFSSGFSVTKQRITSSIFNEIEQQIQAETQFVK